MTDSAATIGMPTDDARALADRAKTCALYDFDTVEMVECKWALWEEIINALRRTAPVAGRDREALTLAWNVRRNTVEECARELEAAYPDHAWLNAACAAIRSIVGSAETPAAIAGMRTSTFDAMISNLVELDKQRSPGPWKKTHDNITVGVSRNLVARCDADWNSFTVDMSKAGKNARFIVALENAWPKILAALSTLPAPVPAGMREALEETTQQLELAHSLLPNGGPRGQVWLTLLKAQRFLTTLPAREAVAGWQFVPTECTPDMVRAAPWVSNVRYGWKQMLAAAPIYDALALPAGRVK